MSKSFSVLFLFISPIILVVSGCDQFVQFEQPQPEGIPNLNNIPKNYEGIYYSKKDSSTLEISADLVIIVNRAPIRVSRIFPQEGIKISGDSLFEEASGLRLSGKIIGDSLDIFMPLWVDTLYSKGMDCLARKFRSRLFLNKRTADGYWTVFLVELQSRDEMRLQQLLAPENISLLDQVTPVEKIESDSLLGPIYRINPNRKELRKLMRQGFTIRGVFRRIKN